MDKSLLVYFSFMGSFKIYQEMSGQCISSFENDPVMI